MITCIELHREYDALKCPTLMPEKCIPFHDTRCLDALEMKIFPMKSCRSDLTLRKTIDARLAHFISERNMKDS